MHFLLELLAGQTGLDSSMASGRVRSSGNDPGNTVVMQTSHVSIWIRVSLMIPCLSLATLICFNLYLDTYGIRMMYSNSFHTDEMDAVLHQAIAVNEKIFKVKYILSHSAQYDSFLFGASRVGVIDVSKIQEGHYYNMSYSMGLPAEHLEIVKMFLTKGVKIKNILVGIDEFSFQIQPEEHKNDLLRMSHPAVSGDTTWDLFMKYYLRLPKWFECKEAVNRLIMKRERTFSDYDRHYGTSIFWKEFDPIIKNDPIKHVSNKMFSFVYHPALLNKKVDECLRYMEELIELANQNQISITVFINPLHSSTYLNNTDILFHVKRKLALLTDYYDFSGINPITTNNLNYYDESHYNFQIGDMIVGRIYHRNNVNLPKYFGSYVTSDNIEQHIVSQRIEISKYGVAQKKQ
jgi:hypothetical protein